MDSIHQTVLLWLMSPVNFINSPLLVAKAILIAAIRALPGDEIAGHSPQVGMHATLADAETASATPAKCEYLAATMA